MIARVLVAVLLSGALAFAQLPRGFYPWWDRPVVKDLNLKQEQMRQIRMTVRDYRSKLIEARQALEKAEGELQEVFDAETVDPKRADAAIENLAQARENLTRAFSQMSLKLRLVLTQDQWKELQARREGVEAARKAAKKQP
jgi:Spy/CpxP family protein refolding chaperone